MTAGLIAELKRFVKLKKTIQLNNEFGASWTSVGQEKGPWNNKRTVVC